MPVNAELAYVFRHLIVQEGAYQLIPPSARALLHQDAIRTLEDHPLHNARGFAREIARHAFEAKQAYTENRRLNLERVELKYLTRAAEQADSSFDMRESADLWQKVVNHNLVQGEELSKARLNLADCLRHAGRADESKAIAQQAHDEDRALESLIALCNALRQLGEYIEARTLLDEALENECDDDVRANALAALAMTLRDLGEVEECKALFTESMALHRKTGDTLAEARTAAGLASVLSREGDQEQAETLYLTAMKQHKQAGDTRGEAIYLGNLGILYQETGRHTEAQDAFENAIDIHRRLGNRTHEGIANSNLASLLKSLGKTREAERRYRQALHVFQESDNTRELIRTSGNLANLLDDDGRTIQSLSLYEDAVDYARMAGLRFHEGLFVGNQALAWLKLGRIDAAMDGLSDGISILTELDAKVPAGAFVGLRADLKLLLGDTDNGTSDLEFADDLLANDKFKLLRVQFLLLPKVRLAAMKEDTVRANSLIAEADEICLDQPEGSDVRTTKSKAEELLAGHKFGVVLSELSKELRTEIIARRPELAD
ncbi:MAG: tetratricopeptide repeat protein [Planctomycetota bacterium]|jgi:tetratricopeptide (TPR) repeat protein